MSLDTFRRRSQGGYIYDKALTGPNDDSGYFNCDEKNVIKVQTYLNN